MVTTAGRKPISADQENDDLAEGASQPTHGPATLAYVADCYVHYPGETVTFFARVEIKEPTADLTLRVSAPPDLKLENYRLLSSRNGRLPYLFSDQEVQYLVWSLEGKLTPGDCYEYQLEAMVGPTPEDIYLESTATLITADQNALAEETVEIQVLARGRYLKYLPALYEQDEFMGRFLMLFESFWGPLQTQIGDTFHYLDPGMTPPHFLPWLASWLDITLHENWSEAQRRELLRWAIALHRSRGTKWGLQKYLEIYTGQWAKITEHRSNNFVLGPEARLGPSIAVGRSNVSHTFVVTLRLPAIEAESKAEQTRLEKIRRQAIEAIIVSQKPAHTIYTLNLQIFSPEEEIGETRTTDGRTGSDDESAAQAAVWFGQ